MLEKSMMFCTVIQLLTLVVNIFYDVPKWVYCTILSLYIIFFVISNIYDILKD